MISTLRNGVGIAKKHGVRTFLHKTTAYLYERVIASYHSYTGDNKVGDEVLEYDADVLVIADACRYDVAQHVQEEYDWVNHIDMVDSKGSATPEWLKNNFIGKHEDAKADTIYISANPYTEQYLNEYDWKRVEKVYEYGFNDELGTVPPDAVTDVAIQLRRDNPETPIIVHYVQPHIPFIGYDASDGIELENWGDDGDRLSVWDMLLTGELDKEEVTEEYTHNLRNVLDEVSLLRRNAEADKMVVTSDHGNAMGDTSELLYGHPSGVANSELRQVPYIQTTATDYEEYHPDAVTDGGTKSTTREKLEALGYV